MTRNLAIGLSLLLCAGLAAASDKASPKDWLSGTWTLCEDPDGSPKDSLQFNPDGSGLVIRSKGNLPFLHKHMGQAVSLLANAHGIAIPIEMSASPGFDKLMLHSDKTGSTSFYVRSEQVEAAGCSVK
jgi:hypothetical protein